jgi:hypothetical protein
VLDPSYVVGAAVNNVVYAILIQEDGSVYIGGSFFEYDGVGRNRLARINGDFSTSIASHASAEQRAWPNPCTDVLYLSQPFTGDLFNIHGAWLRTHSNINVLPVQDLMPGVYLLRSTNGAAMRFVKE